MTATVSASWTSPTGRTMCCDRVRAGTSSSWTRRTAAPVGGLQTIGACAGGLLGCTGVDFTSILAKQRQEVTAHLGRGAR